MEQLGHSIIKLTKDIYSHVLLELQRQAADTMGGLFGAGDEDRRRGNWTRLPPAPSMGAGGFTLPTGSASPVGALAASGLGRAG